MGPNSQEHQRGGIFQAAHNFGIYGGTFVEGNVLQGTHNAPNVLKILCHQMAPNALHNSAARFDAPKCQGGMYKGVIEEILYWLKDRSAPTRVLCVTGSAGIGKSALEQTIANVCAKAGILAATFFFSTLDSTRNNESHLAATLAYQIAKVIPQTRPHILDSIENDPSIFHQSFESQLEVLIAAPLRQTQEQLSGGSSAALWPHCILIDALDECQGTEHQAHVLRAIHDSLIHSDLPFRILLASRPEPTIRTALSGYLADASYSIVLDKDNPDIVEPPALPRTFSQEPSNMRSIYRGNKRKLVIMFDVGICYSSVCYALFNPGRTPEVLVVKRFPRDKCSGLEARVPSVIYYDHDGRVRAIGAETQQDGVFEQAEDEQWIKAEWFKLHLCPQPRQTLSSIPPLPPHKTATDVLSDFLGYLHVCAADYIKESHADGYKLWASVEAHIEYVLSLPNAWGGAQQQVRDAVVLADLVPDNRDGYARVAFVSEGEAAVRFAIQNGFPIGDIGVGEGVILVSAGGGTIDITSYVCGVESNTLVLEEATPPQCHYQGSVFITTHARIFLDSLLRDSPYHEDLDHIVRCFDSTTKQRFNNIHTDQLIKFGSVRDRDEAVNIRFGQLKLRGSDVAAFFEPSIRCVIDGVLEQRKLGHIPISHVIMVGSLSMNDWLFTKVREALQPQGLSVFRPDMNGVRAVVAEGAIFSYLDSNPQDTVQVSKITYGYFRDILYNPQDREHAQREQDMFVTIAGLKRIRNMFDVILAKGTDVLATTEIYKLQFLESKRRSDFKKVIFPIWCYRGQDPSPRWKDEGPEHYTKLCTLEFELSSPPLATRRAGTNTFYRLDYEIVFFFGLAELKADLTYVENGVEERVSAKIIYESE